MDVRFTDEQNLLRDSAREFLAKECPLDLVRAVMDDPVGATDGLWRQLVDMGWLGLTLPEEHGGAGLGLVELAVVLEEMGRVLVPAPFWSTVALGGQAIVLAGTDAQKQTLLPKVAAGELRISLAMLEDPASWEVAALRAEASVAEDGAFEVSGAKHFVEDAPQADAFLVAVRNAESPWRISLLLVDADAPGITLRPVSFVDQTRKVGEVRFEGVRVPADRQLGGWDDGAALIERLLDYAKVALAAEMCGGAATVLAKAVDYAKVREQFGKPIGSFQAIQHKAADMLVLVESARSAAYYAAWMVENEPEQSHAPACLAKAYCSDAYAKVASEGIQIHGGQGFTWEQDLHLYYKRAKASGLSLGSASHNRELAARVMLDGA